jgi:hypothetical protein
VAYLLSAPANASKTITWSWTTSVNTEAWADEFNPNGNTVTFDTSIAGTGASGTTINSPSVTPAASISLAYATAVTAGNISAPIAGATLGSWTGSDGAITNGNMSEYGFNLAASTAVQFTQSSAAWACMAMTLTGTPNPPLVSVGCVGF